MAFIQLYPSSVRLIPCRESLFVVSWPIFVFVLIVDRCDFGFHLLRIFRERGKGNWLFVYFHLTKALKRTDEHRLNVVTFSFGDCLIVFVISPSSCLVTRSKHLLSSIQFSLPAQRKQTIRHLLRTTHLTVFEANAHKKSHLTADAYMSLPRTGRMKSSEVRPLLRQLV